MPAGRSARCAIAGSASSTRIARWPSAPRPRSRATSPGTSPGPFTWPAAAWAATNATRVCPAGIDLRLLNLSLAKAAEENFGFRAGMDPAAEPIIGAYSPARPRGVHPMSELLTATALRQLVDTLDGRRQARGRSAVRQSPRRPASARSDPLRLAQDRRPIAARRLHCGRQLDQGIRLPAAREAVRLSFQGEADRTAAAGTADDRADHCRRPGPATPRRCRSSIACSTGTSATSSTTAAAS